MWKLNYKSSLVAALMVLTVTATPAWALDWHDPEWTGLGCPSKLSGDWIPLTDSPYTGLKIEFKPNGATLSSKENTSILYTFTQNLQRRSTFESETGVRRVKLFSQISQNQTAYSGSKYFRGAKAHPM